MNRLQENLLEILIEIDRICRKYDIMYFLDSGTALGAVRHKGFIPWDDDADIGMLRTDYEKFLSAAKCELDEKFFLQTTDTEPNFYQMHAKIRKNGTRFIETATRNVKMHQGIFVDIFPFDIIPKANANNIYNSGRRKRYELYEWGISNLYTKSDGTLLYFARFLMRKFKYGYCHLFKSRDKIINDFLSNYTQFSFEEDEEKVVVCYSYSVDCIYPIDFFYPSIEAEFEGHSFKLPAKYHEYLSMTYGDDYMELPPEEKRRTHNSYQIEFTEDNAR